MSNENSYDAIIIGAGVMGAAIGYELAQAGRRTLNIDNTRGGLRVDEQQ